MPEKTVKIFSYNLFMRDQSPNLKKANMTRAKLIGDMLAKSDYDVLVFSEAFDDDARTEMSNRLLRGGFTSRTAVVGYSDEFNPAHHIPGSILLGAGVPGAIGAALGLTAGQAIFVGVYVLTIGLGALFSSGHPKSDGGIFIMSRWPIEAQSQVVYPEATGKDKFAKKGVSWAVINKEGFYFNVFGTHTQADLKPGDRPYTRELARQAVIIRRKQLKTFRSFIDLVQMYWQPALLAGDMNVDYCFDKDRCVSNEEGEKGCCSTKEREFMLATLNACLPQDLSKFTYTSDPANGYKGDADPATTLDYVLHSKAHRAPIRSSLETVKLQGPKIRPWDITDLSDHYGVLGTYTFPVTREDSIHFIGTWKCVSFKGRPDTHNHRLTCYALGSAVINEFDGKVEGARFHDLRPGGANSGKIVFKMLPSNALVEYEYTFSRNPDFDRYFHPGDIRPHQRNRPLNSLLLKNRDRSMFYAFERWPLVEPVERPGGRPE